MAKSNDHHHHDDDEGTPALSPYRQTTLNTPVSDARENGQVVIAHQHTKIRKGETLDSVFNLCNSVIGGGILTIPYAVQSSGIGLVLILAVIFAAMVDQSIYYLTRASNITGQDSYESLATVLYGYKMMIATRVSKAFLCFMACVGYLIASGSALKPVAKEIFGEDSDVHDERVIITILLIPVFAVASLKTLYAARWVSYGAIFSVLFLCLVIFIKIADYRADEEDIKYFDFGVSTLSSFGLFFFAFGCHLSSIVLYNEMRDPNPEKFRIVVHSTMVITFCLYLSMGIAGYISFGDNVESNIMDNYEDDNDGIIIAARIFLALSLLFTYPHVSYVVRQVVHDIFWPAEEMKQSRLIGLTIAIVASSATIAIVYPDLRSIFSIAGSTCGVANYYFFPCMFFLKALKRQGGDNGFGQNGYQKLDDNNESIWSLFSITDPRRRGATILMFVGLSTGAVSLISEVLEMSGVI